jgi:hypothetical protein
MAGKRGTTDSEKPDPTAPAPGPIKRAKTMTGTGSTQHVSQLSEDSKHNAHKEQRVFSMESPEAGLIVMERDNLTLASFVDFTAAKLYNEVNVHTSDYSINALGSCGIFHCYEGVLVFIFCQ